MIDSKGREWHVFEREDGSVTVYYTRKGKAVYYVVYDSLNASQHRAQRTDDGVCESCGNNCWKLVCETCGAE